MRFLAELQSLKKFKSLKMPYRCSILDCNGRYEDKDRKLYRLPAEDSEKSLWINHIPHFNKIKVKLAHIRICNKHWPDDTPMLTMRGGKMRPKIPPCIFDVPLSSLPTPQPPPRKPKVEYIQQQFFDKWDKFTTFTEFKTKSQKFLLNKYQNLHSYSSPQKITFIFMNKVESQSEVVISVYDKPTLCSAACISAFKYGAKVPIPRGLIEPNNGISRFSQFYEAVNFVLQNEPAINCCLSKVSESLSEIIKMKLAEEKLKKILFIKRQVDLLQSKKFNVNDYCFAMECYPRCGYEQLREALVLPCPRKMKAVISGVGLEEVAVGVFSQMKCPQQKYCFLLVDEVKIRPTIAFSSGVLSGFSKNNPSEKADAMLAIMAKCLHGGPSIMISITPVNKLTADYQYDSVKNAAAVVEKCGGVVLGSITDNNKVNQNYCSLFLRNASCSAIHPLDEKRVWYLLYDTVHLFKSLRNNWITESNKTLTFDEVSFGSFEDIQQLYELEKSSILKVTKLTRAAVYPTPLQRQNVKHVLHVFSDKVVAALKANGLEETSRVVAQVLLFWKTVNVKSNLSQARVRDSDLEAQCPNSTVLQDLIEMFRNAKSGHGKTRKHSITHDTRKAIIQTLEGFLHLSTFLYSVGFEYVLLGEIQSDRLEGEFGVYRQSTGGNSFMSARDVSAVCKKRLAKFSATFLKNINLESPTIPSHTCSEISYKEAFFIENFWETSLSDMERYAVAYISGWLESKCPDLHFDDEDSLLSGQEIDYVLDVSRGGLKIPHQSTNNFVKAALCYFKATYATICCRNKVVIGLTVMNSFHQFGTFQCRFIRRLANVLLKGLHNLDKDQSAVLYQTSIKKARLS